MLNYWMVANKLTIHPKLRKLLSVLL